MMESGAQWLDLSLFAMDRKTVDYGQPRIDDMNRSPIGTNARRQPHHVEPAHALRTNRRLSHKSASPFDATFYPNPPHIIDCISNPQAWPHVTSELDVRTRDGNSSRIRVLWHFLTQVSLFMIHLGKQPIIPEDLQRVGPYCQNKTFEEKIEQVTGLIDTVHDRG